MFKLKIASVLVLSTLFQPSLADTEFEGSIPVEVVEALFNSYLENQFAMYSDIAEEFPDFPVPDEFTVIGSVSQMSTLRVVFETGLDEEEAIQTITDVFKSQGWIDFPLPTQVLQEVGFVSPNQFNMGRSHILCHNDLGNMTIRYSARDSGNYLSTGVSKFRNRQQGSCEQQIAMQQTNYSRMLGGGGLRQYFPRMEIPESDNRSGLKPVMIGGSSTSNNTAETDGSMVTDKDTEEVYRIFADQIEEQGWQLVSQVISTLSAYGTWTKTTDDSLDLIGRLLVFDTGNSNYDLQFVLSAEDNTN